MSSLEKDSAFLLHEVTRMEAQENKKNPQESFSSEFH